MEISKWNQNQVGSNVFSEGLTVPIIDTAPFTFFISSISSWKSLPKVGAAFPQILWISLSVTVLLLILIKWLWTSFFVRFMCDELCSFFCLGIKASLLWHVMKYFLNELLYLDMTVLVSYITIIYTSDNSWLCSPLISLIKSFRPTFVALMSWSFQDLSSACNILSFLSSACKNRFCLRTCFLDNMIF